MYEISCSIDFISRMNLANASPRPSRDYARVPLSFLLLETMNFRTIL